MKPFWIFFVLLGTFFAVLFSFRLGLFNKSGTDQPRVHFSSIDSAPERESWMNIIQNGRKIGFSHTVFLKTASGYALTENLYMRINTMGLAQDINVRTYGTLHSDFSLSSFDFGISSGRFNFAAAGKVSEDTLSIKTESSGDVRRTDIPIEEKIYLSIGIIDAVMAGGLTPGDRFSFQMFDPAAMGQEPVFIKVIGKEDIMNMGITKRATKVSLSFRGVTQTAWIGEDGDVLKEEGLLGITLEKTMPEDARDRFSVQASQDLTQVASVPSNVIIQDAMQLERLAVEISGINIKDIRLDGGRQMLKDNLLTIQKESLSGLPPVLDAEKIREMEPDFTESTPFIQSDHPKIRGLANTIVSEEDPPLVKARKLVAWIDENVEKRPVLSLPDALSTLENRVGDCNEHAVLLAALARAAGIPAKLEAGLVYLNGRFFYHAWNLLYLGSWITVDSLFGQIPADVTHIRFFSGAQKLPFDIMGIIGIVKLKVIEQEI